ncbi:MAG: UDP-N-acetylglucosamine 1-carboxyvinyltransferase [Candidatus Doudnabacteria bacterium]|nr:UDP-N-acetylglucosamine 1-carboxyvinyltransferase [Candidatus Doudnabacteria bacterium]
MAKFLISGGKKLSGEIKVSGSKNAVLALMAACLLTEDECTLANVPEIDDVRSMAEILKALGVEVKLDRHKLVIRASEIKNTKPSGEWASKLRGSILCLGPLLARAKNADFPFPGGDLIGKRPIDAHLEAFKILGAAADTSSGTLKIATPGLIGAKVVLEETSVTATENIMMAATLASGTTVIKLAAMEPHVQQLGIFLKKMGAKIKGIGTPTITIIGVSRLHGAKIKVIPDSEEAASLITLAAATRSDVKVSRLNPEFLEDYLLKLKKMNVQFEVGSDFVHIHAPAGEYHATKLQVGFYPKLNSDFIPPMSVLATQAVGDTLIYDWLYENRTGYVPELVKMGATAEVLDPHKVRISGPTPLRGANLNSSDLRMGVTLVIAALIAEGRSEIIDIHHIDRGYEHFEKRLKKLGADIKRLET